MNRREFITLLGGAAVAWPLAARAQQPAVPVIGFLHSALAKPNTDFVAAFRQGLKEIGYVEGENVTIEYRWADGHNDRLAELAADLLRRQVNVIVAAPGTAALAAKAATSTIPIVFEMGGDPIAVGLVDSLSQPHGNVTGITNLSGVLNAKRLEIMHELVPHAALIAVLINPTSNVVEPVVADLKAAALALGVQIQFVWARTEDEIDAALENLAKLRAGALVVTAEPFFVARRDQIAVLAARYAIPTIHAVREFTVAGGLMSYAAQFSDAYRLTGLYTGRILKGEKPANLPVQQAVKIELVINLKAAKALGLEVPMSLLMRVNEVIE
jgi:putative ABC transport system substrate-binding protein